MSKPTGSRTDPDFGQRLMAAFEAVADLPPALREARIEELCSGDAALESSLRALLARDSEPGALDADLGSSLQPLLQEALPALQGDPVRIGPYRVLQLLGEGGMGRVYRALREDSPVQREVAIKLIRPDRAAPGLLARFEAERRHLAALDHPGICRFIDADALEDGSPYVVMEAVQGEPLIDYCERRGLGLRPRLQLLRKLLDAVAHAHDRLLVHRDIKPQNVLVTAEGQPKLLDFGIAKSVEEQQASHTRTAERFFTPNASAPEQLLGQATGVAGDVYSLGALAYELLSGALPFDFEGLRAAEIERLILQVAPAPMSSRARQPWARELRGDLDAIVATCLLKDPKQRYANVAALDAELQRYLDGRPIHARAPGPLYRARLFVRRHRTAVALSGALALAILGSSLTLALQAVELRQQRNLAVIERDRALQVVELLEEAFRNADPARAQGDQVSARQILDAAAPGVEAIEHSNPALFARLAGTLARVELDLTQHARAADWARRGVAAADKARMSGEELTDLLLTASLALSRQGDFRQSIEILDRLRAQGAQDRIEFIFAEARVNLTRSRFDEALKLLDNALDMADASGLTAESLLANEIRWLKAHVLGLLSRHSDAVELSRSHMAWGLKTLPEDHPWIFRSQVFALGNLVAREPSPELTEKANELISLLERKAGISSAIVGDALRILAENLLRLGERDKGIESMRRSLEISITHRGRDHLDSYRTAINLAELLRTNSKPEDSREAQSLLEWVVPGVETRYPPPAQITVLAHSRLALTLLDLMEDESAITLLASESYQESDSIDSKGNLRVQLSALERALQSPLCKKEEKNEPSPCSKIRDRAERVQRRIESDT